MQQKTQIFAPRRGRFARPQNLVLAAALLGAILGPRLARSGPIDPALRQRCVATLRETLRKEPRWVKVHAAEDLLSLDYAQGVRDTFLAEQEAHGNEPQYRIGIWRVLARGTADDKVASHWRGKIRAVFADPAAPDRLHAVESLAKLGYKAVGADWELLAAALGDSNGSMAAYAAWVLVNSGDARGEPRLAELLQSGDARSRAAAAYAVRHLPAPGLLLRRQVLEAAAREPAASEAHGQLVCAAAVVAWGESQDRWRQALVELARGGSPTVCAQACDALGRLALAGDLPLLVKLLDSPDADVRCGAARAVLRLERRTPHFLGWIDWSVIGLYGLGVVAVGFYYSRRARTREDYLLGGRQMRPVIMGLSMFASLLSTLSYLAYPGEVVQNGPMILGVVCAYPFVVAVVGWLIIPYVMKLRVTSAYEILETRLGLGVRMLGSLMFLTLRLLWMGMIIFAATSKVLVPLFGLPPAAAPVVCVVLGLVTVACTSMGGLKAVVFTDVVQTAILFGSAILVVVFVTYSLGGVGQWWPAHWPEQWPAPKLYDPTARIAFLTAVLAALVWHVSTAGSDQIAIQRYLSTRDATTARTVLITTLAADTVIGAILATVGLGLWAYFRANPYLLPDGCTILADADHLLPRFIVVGFPVGLSGLVVAGLLGCAMSCLAAGVNSSCSVITVDFLERFRRRRGGADGSRVRAARHVSWLVGLTVILLSFLMQFIPGNLLELCYKVVNLLTAPIFGLFFMALFVRWATAWATIAGALCGIAAAISINYWEQFTGMKGISFLWSLPVSFVVEVGVATLLSLIPLGHRAARSA